MVVSHLSKFCLKVFSWKEKENSANRSTEDTRKKSLPRLTYGCDHCVDGKLSCLLAVGPRLLSNMKWQQIHGNARPFSDWLMKVFDT